MSRSLPSQYRVDLLSNFLTFDKLGEYCILISRFVAFFLPPKFDSKLIEFRDEEIGSDLLPH